jgi:hypothetical protein
MAILNYDETGNIYVKKGNSRDRNCLLAMILYMLFIPLHAGLSYCLQYQE